MMFNQKTILITGASTGLGRALAIALSEQGANLILVARNLTLLQETATMCQQTPLLIASDVTEEADCLAAITAGIKQFGSLDYLILNAGISMWSYFDTLPSLTSLHKIMETNYFGAVNYTHHALPYLKQSKGMIVVISSVQGKTGAPYHSGYAASKHAVQGFFDSLRIELKSEHVDVLTVCPGWIEDTHLKQNALGDRHLITPATLRKHRKVALPLTTCVKHILISMKKRKRELVMPKHYRWIPLLKLLSPRLLDFLVARKI